MEKEIKQKGTRVFDDWGCDTLLEEYFNSVPIAGGTENIETMFELDSDTASDDDINNCSDSNEI